MAYVISGLEDSAPGIDSTPVRNPATCCQHPFWHSAASAAPAQHPHQEMSSEEAPWLSALRRAPHGNALGLRQCLSLGSTWQGGKITSLASNAHARCFIHRRGRSTGLTAGSCHTCTVLEANPTPKKARIRPFGVVSASRPSKQAKEVSCHASCSVTLAPHQWGT